MANYYQANATITNAGAGGFPPQDAPSYPLKQGNQITIQSMGLVDSSGNKVDYAIIYMGMLKTLLSERILKFTANQIHTTGSASGGVLIYFIANRMTTRDYSQGTKLPNNVGADKVPILVDRKKEISWTFETLDLDLMKAPTGSYGTVDGLLMEMWLLNQAKAVELYLFFKELSIIVKGAKDPKAAFPIKTINIQPQATVDQYRWFWREISNTIKQVINVLNEHYVGLDPEDGTLLVSPLIYNDLLLATTNLGSDISTQMLVGGRITQIGGINIMECPQLGNKIEAGQYKGDENEVFDFSGLNALWVHREAIGWAFSKGQVPPLTFQNNGNPHFLHKFNVSDDGAILRKEGIIAFNITNNPPTPPKFR